MSARHLEILRHALGMDDKGRQRHDRNHFVTGPGSTDYLDCAFCVEAGWMTRTPGNDITGGDDVFRVTDAGRVIAKDGIK